MAEHRRHPELIDAFRRSVLLPRRAVGLALVTRGQQRGDIRRDIEPVTAVDLFAGPFLARVFAGEDTGHAWRRTAFAALVDPRLGELMMPLTIRYTPSAPKRATSRRPGGAARRGRGVEVDPRRGGRPDRDGQRRERDREPQHVVDEHRSGGGDRRAAGGDRVQRDQVDQARDVRGHARRRGRRRRRPPQPLGELGGPADSGRSLRFGISPRGMPAAKPIVATPATIVNTPEKVECPSAADAVEGEHDQQPDEQAREQAGDAEGQQRAHGRRRPQQREDGDLARRRPQAAEDAEHHHVDPHRFTDPLAACTSLASRAVPAIPIRGVAHRRITR